MAPKRIRIELDEPAARALHGALTAALATRAARPAGAGLGGGGPGADGADGARRGGGARPRRARRADEGAALARERWAARSPTPHWRIPAPALPYRPLRVEAAPADRRCPSAGCEGSVGGRSATWKALVRDGSVEWTCPACSRTWLIYLQAYDDVWVPAYRDPDEGDHNRPHWRSGR